MQKTPFIWLDGALIPWESANIHLINHSLHYGSAVFEGERFYETGSGEGSVFRLHDHTKRLLYSAQCLQMNVPFTAKEIDNATIAVVQKGGITSGYIRPIIFYGEKMGLNPKGAPLSVAIAAWGWGKYLPDRAISVKISKYIRIHPKSTINDAKISGHYVNSILAVQELAGKYDEALLLDFEGNVAEGPGENLFLVKDGALYTPQVGNILHGITRSTLITLAKERGMQVVEKKIQPEELFDADELFFTGSAAEVTPIGSVDDRNIGDGTEGPITKVLKDAYTDVVHGRSPDHEKWLTRIVL